MKEEKKDLSVWEKYNSIEKKDMFSYCERYRNFISENKTERECVVSMVKILKENDYIDLKEAIKIGQPLKAGDKVYANYNNKALIMYCIGQKPFYEGMNILGAHIDSPRLDLKPNPLYEDSNFAMFKTHYYGGVKKYQWVAMPLALHGVIAKKTGEVVNIVIGEDINDPVVGISDLLIHLSSEQMEKKLKTAIGGEDLNICIGTLPVINEDGKDSKKTKDKVKANILKLLKEKYEIEEEDFVSAEIEVVPAGPARDYGIDRSMIMGYGQDDRVCAYASFEAHIEVKNPEKTTVGIFVDKEEIGSVGASGMKSKYFENTLAELINLQENYSDIILRRTLANSKMLSSDVNAGHDPNFPSVLEKNNAPKFGKGVVFLRYTGRAGKAGSNEANAEYVAQLRKIMEDNKIAWQTGELGRIDLGGGGTIAYILADYGMDVIDCGIPVHSMHAPWEISSKIDIFEMHKAYIAFLINA